MKLQISIPILSLLFITAIYAADKFAPRIDIEHQKHVNQALEALLKEYPDIDPKNLSFKDIDYRFQFEDNTTQICTAKGCEFRADEPYREQLTVGFVVLDSKEVLEIDGRQATRYIGIEVTFPTPRNDEWMIGESLLTEYH